LKKTIFRRSRFTAASVCSHCTAFRSRVIVLLTNHTTPGHSIETEDLYIRLDNAPEPIEARIQRVDEDHANPKRLWRELGQTESLSDKDIERLEKASQVITERQSLRYDDGSILLKSVYLHTQSQPSRSTSNRAGRRDESIRTVVFR
jgi:hypothetical protein